MTSELKAAAAEIAERDNELLKLLETERAKTLRLEKQVRKTESDCLHWKANHDHFVNKLRHYEQRPDLTINKLEEALEKEVAKVKKLREALQAIADGCDDAQDVATEFLRRDNIRAETAGE